MATSPLAAAGGFGPVRPARNALASTRDQRKKRERHRPTCPAEWPAWTDQDVWQVESDPALWPAWTDTVRFATDDRRDAIGGGK